MKKDFCIIKVNDENIKSTYTKNILKKLPEWFADKKAIDNYSKEVKKLPYWAAFNNNNECIGFLSIKIHYKYTAEIFVCGILSNYQHKSIGKSLYNIAQLYMIKHDLKYVIVKTLSDIVEFKPYEQTRKFYKSVGFNPLITLTEMWDEENPCLIMIKTII